jgi:hypothetical protein
MDGKHVEYWGSVVKSLPCFARRCGGDMSIPTFREDCEIRLYTKPQTQEYILLTLMMNVMDRIAAYSRKPIKFELCTSINGHV